MNIDIYKVCVTVVFIDVIIIIDLHWCVSVFMYEMFAYIQVYYLCVDPLHIKF